MPAVKSYIAAFNNVSSLAGLDLAASLALREASGWRSFLVYSCT